MVSRVRRHPYVPAWHMSVGWDAHKELFASLIVPAKVTRPAQPLHGWMDGKFTPLGADGNLYRLRTNWLSSTSCSDWVFPHEERQGLLQFLLGPCNFVGLSCTLLVSVSHQHSRFQGIHGVLGIRRIHAHFLWWMDSMESIESHESVDAMDSMEPMGSRDSLRIQWISWILDPWNPWDRWNPLNQWHHWIQWVLRNQWNPWSRWNPLNP